MSPTKVIKTSIHVSAFPADTAFHVLLHEAAEAGFEAIELTLDSKGPLSIDIPQPDCIHIAGQVRDAGMAVSSLWISDSLHVTLASPNLETRRSAYDQTLTALDRAVWLGCDTVILPLGAGEPADLTATSWQNANEETYTHALDALLRLRFEAQSRAVHIACRSPMIRFLLSPMEMRDFIDHVNSPWIGVCLELAELLPYGLPQDWIIGLGHRIRCVHLNDVKMDCHGRRIGEGDIDWPVVSASLSRISYQGPIVYPCPPFRNDPKGSTAHGPRSPSGRG